MPQNSFSIIGYNFHASATTLRNLSMNEFAGNDDNLDLLKIRVQNLKVLLEEAILSGSHHRMKQLLADIKMVEDRIAAQRERENGST
ncbi:MAG: hypothetical protein JNK79_13000 [Chitinophagaceae bacterium]|nr:hypothetical protein [Chitinophagaceae bacterium]